MSHFLTVLASWLVSLISRWGWPAIFILMFFGSAMVPIPSEVVMPFAGFLVTQGVFGFWSIVLVGTISSVAGSLAAWALGYWGEEALAEKLIRKYGKYLLISYDEVEQMKRWFNKRGEFIVFATRLMPVIRAFVSLPAGFAKMNVVTFTVYTFAGAGIWNILLTWLGVKLGKNWETIGVYFKKFDLVIMLAGILIIGWYLQHKVKKLKKKGSR